MLNIILFSFDMYQETKYPRMDQGKTVKSVLTDHINSQFLKAVFQTFSFVYS